MNPDLKRMFIKILGLGKCIILYVQEVLAIFYSMNGKDLIVAYEWKRLNCIIILS